MNNYRLPPTGWVWTGNGESVDHRLILFKKELTLDAAPDSAVVKVSADSRYRLYVNGTSVSFGPCKGDDQVWYYETVEIAGFLKPGVNILVADVLRLSPFSKGNHSIWRTSYPGFYMHGEIRTGGEIIPLIADETWEWQENKSVKFIPENNQRVYLDIFENATGCQDLHGWMNPRYNAANWQKAVPYTLFQLPRGTSPANLLPGPIPQMYERPANFVKVEKIRKSTVETAEWAKLLNNGAVNLEPHSGHIIEIDAGELTTGFLMFKFANGAQSQIEIMTAESYVYPPDKDAPHPMPVKGNRTDSENGTLRGFLDYYTVGGFGSDESPEIYEPFWFRTFRFVRLKIKTGGQPLRIANFSYRETGYPLEAKTIVETSDKTLTPIWDISLRSLRRCMHETYEDCPFYEQLQYAMDTRTQILFTYAVAADDRMARRAIDDFHRSLRYDGLTNCCWPTVSPNVIPGFSLFYVMMIHDHMMYFGDEALVARYMPTVDAILGFFARNLDGRGLVNQIGGVIYASPRWSFIDWTTQWSRTAGVPDAIAQGPITMESLLYAYALDMASELADYIGKPAQATEYKQRASDIKTAVNTYCRDSEGLYTDGPGVLKYSQHSQVWAVLTETVSKENRAYIMEKALSEDGWAKCSVAMAFYLFRALEMADMYERTSELWQPWREMVKNNLTTCQENDTDARSDCHAWGSLALYELPGVILGVRPAKPGYSAVAVKPTIGYLQWAKGSVCTPRGEIHVKWHRDGDNIKTEIHAPDGVEIESGIVQNEN